MTNSGPVEQYVPPGRLLIPTAGTMRGCASLCAIGVASFTVFRVLYYKGEVQNAVPLPYNTFMVETSRLELLTSCV